MRPRAWGQSPSAALLYSFIVSSVMSLVIPAARRVVEAECGDMARFPAIAASAEII